MKTPRKESALKRAKAVADAGVSDHCRKYELETGLQLRTDVATVLRCRVCRSVLVPARAADCWYCERMMCGPLLSEQLLAERLHEAGAFASQKAALNFVREFRPEAARAYDGRPPKT